jgi:tRNA-2-methylthio-N6-dimethylallyladenosine synthase
MSSPEIAGLADRGVREVNLLGQNVNAYRGRNHLNETVDFAELLHLVNLVPGIERIRYTTSHPVEFSEAIVACYGEIPALVDHLHLPVQSGSDRILMAMKRGHTTLEYKATIRALRRLRPNISLSSDFIIGFPGETEDDFAATMGLIEEIGFDTSFSFIYSARPGTPAAELPDDTPESVKKQRLHILQGPNRAASATDFREDGRVPDSGYWSPALRKEILASSRAGPKIIVWLTSPAPILS